MQKLSALSYSCWVFLAVLVAPFFLTGCDQMEQVAEAEKAASHWLNGTWEFDEAFTEKHWKQVREKHDAAEGGIEGMIDTAKHWGEEAAAPWILGGLKNSSLKFNGIELITTKDDGKGHASPYLAIDSKGEEEATLQFTDGSVVNYKRVGDHLRVPFDSKFANYVFYRRVD